MDLNDVCLLVFASLLSADGVFAGNDCHPKGYGKNDLHACIEGVASGLTVAIDASKFNGASCECQLSGKTGASFTVKINYKTNNMGKIKFYVDDDEYNESIADRVYSSNGENITIRAEMEGNINDNTKDGNPCLAFSTPFKDQSHKLTIECFNGTGMNPEIVAQGNTSRDDTRVDSATVTTTTGKIAHLATTTQIPDTQWSTTHTPASSTHTTVKTGQAPTDSTRNIDNTKHVLTSLTHSSISTTQVASSTTESSGSLPENTHDTNTNAGTVLESDVNGMEITSQGLEENLVTVDMMEEEPTSPRVSALIIFAAVGCASLAVVVAILLFICYFKRRKSNASPAIVKADAKAEEEYENTENAMYIPMEIRNLLEDADRDSTHTYEDADMDMITNNRNKQNKPPLVLVNDRHVNGVCKETQDTDRSDDVGEKLDNDGSKFVYDLAKDIFVYDLAKEMPDTETKDGYADVVTSTDKNEIPDSVQESTEHIYDVST